MFGGQITNIKSVGNLECIVEALLPAAPAIPMIYLFCDLNLMCHALCNQKLGSFHCPHSHPKPWNHTIMAHHKSNKQPETNKIKQKYLWGQGLVAIIFPDLRRLTSSCILRFSSAWAFSRWHACNRGADCVSDTFHQTNIIYIHL